MTTMFEAAREDLEAGVGPGPSPALLRQRADHRRRRQRWSAAFGTAASMLLMVGAVVRATRESPTGATPTPTGMTTRCIAPTFESNGNPVYEAPAFSLGTQGGGTGDPYLLCVFDAGVASEVDLQQTGLVRVFSNGSTAHLLGVVEPSTDSVRVEFRDGQVKTTDAMTIAGIPVKVWFMTVDGKPDYRSMEERDGRGEVVRRHVP